MNSQKNADSTEAINLPRDNIKGLFYYVKKNENPGQALLVSDLKKCLGDPGFLMFVIPQASICPSPEIITTPDKN